MLRRRAQQLQGAPFTHDALRFPSFKEVTRLLTENRAHRDFLLERRKYDVPNAGYYDVALKATEQAYRFWYAVKDSRCEYYFVNVRRAALKKVINMIGYENFYSGNYPLPVPYWQVQR